MFVGGLAGVVGGWWAGKAASEAAHHYTPEVDATYRSAYESSPSRLADRSFDDVRPGVSGRPRRGDEPRLSRPRLRRGRGRSASAVGPTTCARSHGEWDAARPFAQATRTRRSRAAAAGSTPPRRPGNAVSDAGHKTANAVSDAGHKAANALDDHEGSRRRESGVAPGRRSDGSSGTLGLIFRLAAPEGEP